MRAWVAIPLAAVIGGCTSVRVVQRDGCWVRQTSGAFRRVHEEVGFCARPPPRWAEDRVTRLAQECVVRADYHWQMRALAAWNRGEPLPPQEPEDRTLQQCMGEATRILAEENGTLKARLAETASERDALRASSEQDRARLRDTLDKVTEQLGDAAKKPSPPAYATANASSEGRNEASAPPSSAAAPITVMGASPAQPPLPADAAAAPVVTARKPPPVCAPDASGRARAAGRGGKKGDAGALACTPPASGAEERTIHAR